MYKQLNMLKQTITNKQAQTDYKQLNMLKQIINN